MSADPLEQLRLRIDEVNRRLLSDLNERLKLVVEVGALKQARGLAMFDPAREERMLQELLATNGGPLTEGQVGEIFQAIFAVMRSQLERGSVLE